MLFNVYIDIGVKKITFLLLDKNELDKIIETYQYGRENIFLKGKTHLTDKIYEIQIYTHEKGLFDDDDQFYEQATLYGYVSKNFFGDTYVNLKGLAFYGKKITGDFIKGEFGYIKSKIQIAPDEKRIRDRELAMELTNYKKLKKIFISHSSIDNDIVKKFVDNILRLGLGLSDKDIFCTSIEGMNILNGDDFRTKIVNELKESHAAVLIITENYKESEVCLNEMGAIWALGLIRFPLINKPINFKNVGFLTEVQQIGQMCSSSDLDNFMESICQKLKIITPKTTTWNSSKTKFLDQLENLPNEKTNNKENIEINTPKLKWGMLKFEKKEGLYCPICYETKSLMIPTTRLNGGKYICNNCKSNF